jgi:hypothetical protein
MNLLIKTLFKSSLAVPVFYKLQLGKIMNTWKAAYDALEDLYDYNDNALRLICSRIAFWFR